MNRNHWKKLTIDERTQADIEERIRELSDSYGTGWQMDEENPDIGYALARIFSGLMKENIDRMGDVVDRYHTEFVNMLDISLLPARPASSIVVFNLADVGVPGTDIPKGTRLLAETDTEPIVFEADHSIYVTGVELSAAYMTDGETGVIAPILGDFVKVPPVAYPREESEEEIIETVIPEEAISEEEETPQIRPFRLFGEKEGIEQYAVVFYHDAVFDGAGESVHVRIAGGGRLADDILAGRYRFEICDRDDALIPVSSCEEITEDGDPEIRILSITIPGEAARYRIGEKSCRALLLTATEPVHQTVPVESVRFASHGDATPAQHVSDGRRDCEVGHFQPFGDTLSLFQECFIGHDDYFRMAGSEITLRFRISYGEHPIGVSQETIDNSLKVIKRKPRAEKTDSPAECCADEVMIEYYNGTGWKRIPEFSGETMLFARPEVRELEIRFRCPDDWEQIAAGAYEGRCLRLQILRADNCYYRPAIHHYPVIDGLSISYSYEESYVDPLRMEGVFGTNRRDLTTLMKAGKGFSLFEPGAYQEDALYLGFSDRMTAGPISILFRIEDGARSAEVPCVFEYASREGFEPLKVLDHTRDFTRSGVVMFLPPSDMARTVQEGKRLCWIRVRRAPGSPRADADKGLPRIMGIDLNAVQVSNIDTRPTQSFYVEEIRPGMRFAIGVFNILDADVWVNEMGRWPREQMKAMLADRPDDTRAEYDITGAISAFYVRWHEVSRLETAEDPRSYRLDRMTGQIVFGDGVKTWLPRVLDDTAFTIMVRCCNGEAGNVPAETINSLTGNFLYIDRVSNPVKAYGGSNIESVDSALERGASILSSRGRLVTIRDYCRAVMAYSDTIDQVAGLVEGTATGNAEDEVTFVLLMKDYADGSYAFHRIVGGLRQYLLKQCELTILPERLKIVEPIFVEISVSVWVKVLDIDHSFEIRDEMRACLDDYLNPLGYGTGRGWRIGVLPGRTQLLMRLSSLKSKAIVRRSVMIARYTDDTGTHEMDLDDVRVTPCMLCRGGEYTVTVMDQM
ncbi:MAG: hypothetical protein II800_00060 [Lachnospiraceae bacterium]|nr:hypothetical protein [Lachnospiraceae bacterium]